MSENIRAFTPHEQTMIRLDDIILLLQQIAAGQPTAPARQVDKSVAPGFGIGQNADVSSVTDLWKKYRKGTIHPKFYQMVSDCLDNGAIIDDFRKAILGSDCVTNIPPWDFVKLVDKEKSLRLY